MVRFPTRLSISEDCFVAVAPSIKTAEGWLGLGLSKEWASGVGMAIEASARASSLNAFN